MRKYVMLSADLHPIGGMQLYTAGKAKYLKGQGWSVYVLFCGSNKPNCSISYLNNFIRGSCPALAFRPAQLPIEILRKALSDIFSYIDKQDGDELLVESQSDITALWGEIIAQKFGTQHICFNCNEQFRGNKKYYEENIDFFAFKFQRKELLGLHRDTNKKLFEGYMTVECSDEFVFDAVEPDPIQDVINDKVDAIKQYDFNISYLGRIVKGYVPNIVLGVAKFAKKYNNKKIQFIIIGNADEKKAEIESILQDVTNVHITYMGDLVPIPRKIYSKIDVMIAGAVCAEISARESVPTIVADCENYLANGILGYTVNNSMYFDPQQGQKTFDEELENVLITKDYLNNKYSFPAAIPTDNIYESHFEFFKKANATKNYFNVLKICTPKISIGQLFWLIPRMYFPSIINILSNLKHLFD